MFERFTPSAIKVITLAQEEARRLGHNFVGTEQILLGLIGEGRGVAALSLRKSNVTLKAARIEVEKIIGRGDGVVAVEIPFTPRAKTILQASWRESTRMEVKYIGTEHLLLGLLSEDGGVANTVLDRLDVNKQKLRELVIGQIKGTDTPLEGLPVNPLFPIFPSNTANFLEEPYNWYTPEAVLLIQRAWGIADSFGNAEIGLEHLFLAILRDNEYIVKAFASVGFTMEQIREQVLKSFKPGDSAPAPSLPFSSDAQKALEYAWVESAEHKEEYVNKECIMLGLLRQDNGVVFDLIKNLNIDLPKLKEALGQSLKEAAQKAKEKKVATAEEQKAKAAALPNLRRRMIFSPLLLALMVVTLILCMVYQLIQLGESNPVYGTGISNFVFLCPYITAILVMFLLLKKAR